MRRRIIGILLAVTIFVVWAFVDATFFPPITGSLGYPIFELVTYGSWFLIVLLILGVLSITGNISTRFSSGQ